MFTGVISSIGSVAHLDTQNKIIAIRAPHFAQKEIKLGASIAIDGVCLSITKHNLNKELAYFDLGTETQQKTLLAKKKIQDLVHLEFPLCMGDPLDGHMVQGHVDSLAKLHNINPNNNSLNLDFTYDPNIRDLLIIKGCVALNGVSLTINFINSDFFSVCLVPITLENTNFSNLILGDLVHVETDIFCRYMRNHARVHYGQ